MSPTVKFPSGVIHALPPLPTRLLHTHVGRTALNVASQQSKLDAMIEREADVKVNILNDILNAEDDKGNATCTCTVNTRIKSHTTK